MDAHVLAIAQLARSASKALEMALANGGVGDGDRAAASRLAADARTLADSLSAVANHLTQPGRGPYLTQNLAAVRSSKTLSDSDPVLTPMAADEVIAHLDAILAGTGAVSIG